MIAYLGKTIRVPLGNRNTAPLHVDVEIRDIKQAYGKIRVLVVPVAGDQERSTWIEIQGNEVAR